MRFGVELAVKAPITEIVESLKTYDAYGFDRVWIPDASISMWEVWTTASLAATHTQRVRIGVGVTAPYHRNPSVMAHAAATIDQLSGGRLDLTIGRGGRGYLRSIGADADDAGVEEAITILRGLLAGEKVSYDGKVFHFEEVSLRVQAQQEHVNIYVATTSDYWMEIAARCADGIHTYSSNAKLLGTAGEWKARSEADPFTIVTTLGFIEPPEAREWWLNNFSRNYNLQKLSGREIDTASPEELLEDLAFTDRASLLAQVDRLERGGADELMIAYRQPEDLPVIAEMVRSIA